MACILSSDSTGVFWLSLALIALVALYVIWLIAEPTKKDFSNTKTKTDTLKKQEEDKDTFIAKTKADETVKPTDKGAQVEKPQRHWYNNSKINTIATECPKGFVPGRLKKNK